MLFVNVVLPVFVIVACGYFAQRRFDLDVRSLTHVGLYLCAPALVFSALVKSDFRPEMAGRLGVFLIAYTLTLWLLAWTVSKVARFDRDTSRALVLTTAMMNCGNFGLPLVYFAFGDAALGASVVTFVLFNIPLSTLAVFLAQKEQTSWLDSLKNTCRNPIFYAVMIALVVRISGIMPPGWLLRPLELLGQAAIPMMLILLGLQLAKTQWQAPVGFLTLSSTLRLVVAPAIAWLLCAVLGIEGLTRQVVILQTSTPSAILPLLYALHYGTRPDLVAGGITLSTILSAGSLTALLYLLT
jgi:predicted permease